MEPAQVELMPAPREAQPVAPKLGQAVGMGQGARVEQLVAQPQAAVQEKVRGAAIRSEVARAQAALRRVERAGMVEVVVTDGAQRELLVDLVRRPRTDRIGRILMTWNVLTRRCQQTCRVIVSYRCQNPGAGTTSVSRFRRVMSVLALRFWEHFSAYCTPAPTAPQVNVLPNLELIPFLSVYLVAADSPMSPAIHVALQT